MKTIFISISIFLTAIVGFSIHKTNYLKIRKQYTTHFNATSDSSKIAATLAELNQIESNSISKNKHLYYQDIAQANMLLFLKTNNQDFLETSANYHKLCIDENTKYEAGYWNLASTLCLLQRCEEAQEYLDVFKQLNKRLYLDKQLTGSIMEACPNMKL